LQKVEKQEHVIIEEKNKILQDYIDEGEQYTEVEEEESAIKNLEKTIK